MDTCIQTKRVSGNRRLRAGWIVLTLCSLTTLTALPAYTQKGETVAMKDFVIIFRQGPRPLSEADKLQRARETSAWAQGQNAAGHLLEPHILTPEKEVRGAELPSTSDANLWPVTAFVLLKARDLEDAAHVAEQHPAVHYGANVEVRAWAAPTPPTVK